MSVINKVLGLFLGNKYERDMKEINPYVEKIHKEYVKLKSLSNDELRDKTEELKKELHSRIEEDENLVRKLKEQAESEEDVYKKEDIYNEIDKIEKNIDVKLEDILDELLPVGFSIVKETARRLKENTELVVTARQYDRDLAATRESITIKGDKAY